MILGLGVDLVSIRRIARLLRIHGEQFEHRFFSAEEIARAGLIDIDARAGYYAKRFAAKEALVKAVGTGIRKGFSFREIATHNDNLGKPFLLLGENTSAHVHSILGEHTIYLSLSDEKNYAIACVVIESR